MAIKNGVAMYGDTGSHILLSNSGLSLTSAIGPNGVLAGTGAINTSNGYNSGSAGSVSFTNIDPNGLLKYAGQIAFDVTTYAIAAPDNLASGVSGSKGENKSATNYILSLEDSVGTDHGYIYINNSEQIRSKTHASDTESAVVRCSTVGKNPTCRMCFWWEGDDAGILTDGARLITYTRSASSRFTDNVFYKLVLGASFNGTSSSLVNGYFTNIVVSTNSPFSNSKIESIGVLGDSFGVQAIDTTVSYRLDANLRYDLDRALMARGLGYVKQWGDHSAAGAAYDPVAEIDIATQLSAFLAGKYQYGMFSGPNNDVVDTSTSLTTADANMKDYIKQAMFADYPTCTIRSQMIRAFVQTAGSLIQETTHNNSTKNARLRTANANVLALESWWNTTFPNFAGDLIVIDLFNALGGDASPNWNYQGEWDTLGNGVATVSANSNRHPSAQGWTTFSKFLAARIDG